MLKYTKQVSNMYYKISNGSISFDGNVLLEDINFQVNDNEKIVEYTKRNVDQERHITDTKPCFILYHCCNTVQSRRCKIVFNDKDIIVKG